MKYQRIINLLDLLQKKSFFLFGPRSTGKSYLIRQQLAEQALVIDLLRGDLFLRLSQNPAELEGLIHAATAQSKIIVLDEVQKIPALLDEVHRLIESHGWRFLLTGSSARKLKRGQANLLAGRAWTAHLFPLCWSEIPRFNLARYLRYGGLPQVAPSEHPEEELHAYTQTYLKEEILAEGIIRKIPPFTRFLRTAALANTQIMNFAKVGDDAQVAPSTVREYFGILEDTLLGFLLEPWMASKKRKAIRTAKFYFFDTGVTHALAGTQTLDRNSNLYGASFEQFIGMELRAYLAYRRRPDPLQFWQSTQGHEVDYVVGTHTAIEVKATTRASTHDVKGLRALQEEKIFTNYYLVSQVPIESVQQGIRALPWATFLQLLWDDRIVVPG